jgi:cell division protein FtsQ
MKVIKKVWDVIRWLIAISIPFVLLAFADNSQKKRAREIRVELKGETPFQTEQSLLQQIESQKDSLGLINIHLLEERLETLNGVSEVEVFSDVREELFVNVSQAKPLFRLFDTDSSYYMNEEGLAMALSPYQTARVPLVSGTYSKNCLSDLHQLFRFIVSDPILKESIDAAEVNGPEKLILFSGRSCAHSIQMGGFEQWEDKLGRLKVFYREVVDEGKRKNFKSIDLRFENQVVLKK